MATPNPIKPFFWGRGGAMMTPEDIAREREMADEASAGAVDFSPIGHWTQGLGRVAQGLMAGLDYRAADAAAEENRSFVEGVRSPLLSALMGVTTASAPTPIGSASMPMPGAAGEIAATTPGGSSVLPPTFLAAVDRTEGGGGYDTLYGNAERGKFAGTAVSSMPIRDVIAFTDPNGPYGQSVKAQIGRVATPVGRHQIVGTTLRNAVMELGLDPNAPFSPEVQDTIALHLGKKRVASADTMQGKIAALRSEWHGFKNVPDDQMVGIVQEIEATPLQMAGGGGREEDRGELRAGFDVASVGDTAAPTSAYVDPMVSAPNYNAAMAGDQAPAMAPAPAPVEVAGGGGRMGDQGELNRAIVQALSDPRVDPGTQRIAQMLMERQASEQAAAQALAQRQATARQMGLDPSIATDDEAWKAMVAANFRDRPTATVNGIVIDTQTGQPIFEAPQQATPEMQNYDAYAAYEQGQGRVPLGPLEWKQAIAGAGAAQNIGSIPQGFQLERDGNTMRLSPIPGGPADMEAAKLANQEEVKDAARETASSVVTNAGVRALQAMNAPGLPADGLTGRALGVLPGTNAAEVRRQVGVLKANATVETLNAMRQASPTGGALGNVTEKEGAMLAAKTGTLDPDSPNFERDLKDYVRTQLEIIHGPQAGREIFDAIDWSGGQSQPGGLPEGVTQEEWDEMTDTERRLFQ